MIEQL